MRGEALRSRQTWFVQKLFSKIAKLKVPILKSLVWGVTFVCVDSLFNAQLI